MYKLAPTEYDGTSMESPMTGTPDFSALCMRARSLAGRGLLDDALGIYSDILAQDPQNATVLADRGTVYAMAKQFDLARADLEGAISLRYLDASIFNTIATVCLEQAQYREALDFYAKAIELNPGYGLTYYNRSNALHRMGDNAAAIRDLEYCLTLQADPEFTQLIRRRLDFLRAQV